jgi:hypothetical protein
VTAGCNLCTNKKEVVGGSVYERLSVVIGTANKKEADTGIY